MSSSGGSDVMPRRRPLSIAILIAAALGASPAACRQAPAAMDGADAERAIRLLIPAGAPAPAREQTTVPPSPVRRGAFPTGPLTRTTITGTEAFASYVTDRDGAVQALFLRMTCRPFPDPGRLIERLVRIIDPDATNATIRRAVGQAETNWRLNVRLPAQVGAYRVTASRSGSGDCQNAILQVRTPLYDEFRLD